VSAYSTDERTVRSPNPCLPNSTWPDRHLGFTNLRSPTTLQRGNLMNLALWVIAGLLASNRQDLWMKIF
jgi:hypothetical protein